MAPPSTAVVYCRGACVDDRLASTSGTRAIQASGTAMPMLKHIASATAVARGKSAAPTFVWVENGFT
jgi:hypothetical protein